MKKLWIWLGNILGVLSWPLVWIIIRFTNRSKLLIICGEETLLLKGWLSLGKWGLTGGGVKRKETPKQGVIREAEEEIGLKFSAGELKSLGRMRATGPMAYDFEAFVINLDSKPPLELQKHEIIEARWVSISKIPKYNCEEYLTQVLEAWKEQR